MRQFMRQQLLPGGAGRIVAAAPEENILAGGKRAGTQGLIERVRRGISMNPHPAEIRSQTRLDLRSHVRRERPADAALGRDLVLDLLPGFKAPLSAQPLKGGSHSTPSGFR